MSEEVPGYATPVYRSLTAPILFAGVPRNVAVILGALAAICLGAYHLYLLAPVFVIAYGAAVAAHRRDPYAFDVLVQNRGSGGGPYLP
jgi:type IV secretory pathway TrbD component